MCQGITCLDCGRCTYSGCGRHVDQVLSGVPASRRRACQPRPERGRRLFGRG